MKNTEYNKRGIINSNGIISILYFENDDIKEICGYLELCKKYNLPIHLDKIPASEYLEHIKTTKNDLKRGEQNKIFN